MSILPDQIIAGHAQLVAWRVLIPTGTGWRSATVEAAQEFGRLAGGE